MGAIDKINLKKHTLKKGDLYEAIVPLQSVTITGKMPYIKSNDDVTTIKEKQKYLLEHDFYDDKLIKLNDPRNKNNVINIQNFFSITRI